MSYLLYCIFREQQGGQEKPPPGVDGRGVFVLSREGLTAAVSELAAPQPDRSDVPHLLAYERIVAWFHQRRTVIPMRYGSVFGEPAEVAGLLEDRRDQYASLLEELDGLDEMGLRLWLDPSDVPSPNRPLPSGTAYLASRREHYGALDRSTWELEQALDGLYARSRRESCDLSGHNLLSLYFLVPRESVERFCEAAQHLGAGMSGKLVWSGPWPPYNFVQVQPNFAAPLRRRTSAQTE